MHRLPLIIFLFLGIINTQAQSPHGGELKMDCIACHTTDGWEIDSKHWNFIEFKEKKYSTNTGFEIIDNSKNFNHFETLFPLQEAHQNIDCRKCHSTLIFEEVSTDCISCHLDVHSGSVGNDCIRCHDSQNWLVDEIPEIHEQNGFALFGVHNGLACVDCHQSETTSRFDRLGNDCISCHVNDYNGAESPNHVDNQYSVQCLDCHNLELDNWVTDIINHTFFPLEMGHDNIDCASCHLTDNYSDASPDCISCHKQDFETTSNPDHITSNFSTDCKMCHTLNPGWTPAEFNTHDSDYFPIYSGEHEGEWDACVDCHMNPDNFAEFTCIACHINPETDEEHDDVSGYVYEDNACLACHPTGDSDMAFDHNTTNFPLTGEHIGVACLDCHTNGFEGTSTNCVDCHQMDFNGSINPNHVELNLPTDCASCHTTDPEWNPAKFDIHDDFHPLLGAHKTIENDCASCHNGDYNNTPATCVGCHLDDYNGTTDPNHTAAQFSTVCATCHSETAWEPATFDHDAQSFPIYSGEHEGEWDACVDCHTNPDNFEEFTCIACHINPETDEEHEGVSGYIYEDNACLACHPTGDADMAFNHNASNFPLTGEHIGVACLDCHANGYEGTSSNCVDCHQMDFNGSINPNHVELNLSTDCASCHTIDPDWMPASLVNHNDFYALEGAHALIANDCATCHNGDYNNTPNTCVGCHQDDFNGTTDPNHIESDFSTNCVACHTETAWEPSIFDHNATAFPLTGEHLGVNCIECHADGYAGTSTNCVDCHQMDFNGSSNPNHVELNLPDDCLSCHTTEPDWMPATFDIHDDFYLLEGVHATIANDCATCHNGDYANTPNTCVGCHQDDFDGTTDPNHVEAQFSTDCIACHAQDAWEPSTFDHSATDFPLTGEHLGVNCIECHADGYAGTSTNCVDCHQMDFNSSINPNHVELNLPTNCASCHTTDPEWMPATFAIHDNFYPLVEAHAIISNNCVACHNGDYNSTPNTCIGCHQDDFDGTTDPNHVESQFSTNCLDCHTQTSWNTTSFNHDDTDFPLTGEHLNVDCIACHSEGFTGTTTNCVDCHQMDFNSSINPNHVELNLPSDCASCHTIDPDWMPATFAIHNDFYLLEGAHAAIANDCAICHNGDYNNTPNTCVGCHQSDFDGTTDPNHVESQFNTDCIACHTQDTWEPSTFDHSATDFPLIGEHLGVNCIECHVDGYAGTSTNCVDCHQMDFNGSINPNHVELNLPTDCASCHTFDPDWMPATFAIHNDFYLLEGAHAAIANDCATCHNGDYTNTPNTCVGCHQDDFDGTTDPNHLESQFSTDCIACHTQDAWEPSTFDHAATDFPLTGEHLGVNCIECHADGYAGTSTNCVDCHQMDFNGSINPNHVELNLPTDCASCHTIDPDWMPATFAIHNDFYLLEGAHAAIANDCATCHNGDYTNTPNTCVGCHQDDFDGTTDPNHLESQFSTDCIACHTQDAWEPSTFDHAATDFPLTGEHLDVNCIECHADGYAGTSANCVDCHQMDFNGSINPNHVELNLPSDCASCHTIDPDWMPATFAIHNNFYLLEGAHAAIANDCATCHNGDYTNTPNTCVGCHQSDFDGTTDPNHLESQFSTDCIACHTQDVWEPSTFDHAATDFPLTGEHLGVNCIECHADGYAGTSTNCVDCHQMDFNSSINPNHVELNLPTDCASCHTIDPDWMPATFAIHDDFYVLEGAHATLVNDCATCHNGDYNNTPNTCVGCHQSDFDGTTDPNHLESQFSTDCMSCHSQDAWEPSTFNHAATNFPLNGAHLNVDCASCHADGYAGTPTECIACHQSDYDNTNDPDHGNAMFPTDCILCHNETEWDPSTFDHDGMYFPIYSGNHQDAWTTCNECHLDNNFTMFSCIECHEHNNQNDVDNDHSEVQEYQYESNACYACHPNGD